MRLTAFWRRQGNGFAQRRNWLSKEQEDTGEQENDECDQASVCHDALRCPSRWEGRNASCIFHFDFCLAASYTHLLTRITLYVVIPSIPSPSERREADSETVLDLTFSDCSVRRSRLTLRLCSHHELVQRLLRARRTSNPPRSRPIPARSTFRETRQGGHRMALRGRIHHRDADVLRYD